MRIFVVEDDRFVAEMLRSSWPDSRDTLEIISSVSSALNKIHSGEIGSFDCMILDINLPDGSGLELMKAARARSSLPIIMISGSGSADARADAISTGADDYVMKPFSTKELRARAARIVSMRQGHSQKIPEDSFQISAVTCDLKRRILSYSDRSIELTAMETRILECLFQRRGQDCPKKLIAWQALFREHRSDDKTIDVYVNRLRGKLNDLFCEAGSSIKTVRGVGYHLV